MNVVSTIYIFHLEQVEEYFKAAELLGIHIKVSNARCTFNTNEFRAIERSEETWPMWKIEMFDTQPELDEDFEDETTPKGESYGAFIEEEAELPKVQTVLKDNPCYFPNNPRF